MNKDELYIFRCIELAKNGFGNVAPNPMVGCVVVNNEKIIGEGYHKKYGEPHAEVNAINSVKDKELLKDSTLFVNLEPCSHFGKTPPCSDFIILNKIPKVRIGCVDSSSKVAGKGIDKLKKAGIDVKVGILEKESRELNKRFFTFHEKKRPYIILKWAQTSDNFIDFERKDNESPHVNWITGKELKITVHKWRSEEQAIIVGTNTALKDNPQLSVREWQGKNPLRIVLDEKLILPETLNLLDNSTPTLVFTALQKAAKKNIEYISIDFKKDITTQISVKLIERKIQSLIVEGGKQLLETFIDNNLWDEARILIGNKTFIKGLKAPKIDGLPTSTEVVGKDKILIYKNY